MFFLLRSHLDIAKTKYGRSFLICIQFAIQKCNSARGQDYLGPLLGPVLVIATTAMKGNETIWFCKRFHFCCSMAPEQPEIGALMLDLLVLPRARLQQSHLS